MKNDMTHGIFTEEEELEMLKELEEKARIREIEEEEIKQRWIEQHGEESYNIMEKGLEKANERIAKTQAEIDKRKEKEANGKGIFDF